MQLGERVQRARQAAEQPVGHGLVCLAFFQPGQQGRHWFDLLVDRAAMFAALPDPFLDLWDRLFGGWGHQWSTGELASMVIALGLLKFLGVMLVQQWQIFARGELQLHLEVQ